MIVRVTPLLDPAGTPANRRLAWLATAEDGRPLGAAFLRVPAAGGIADLELHVHPAERRAGVGTRLLDEVLAATPGLDLKAVLTDSVRDGSDGDLFCRSYGLRPVLTLLYTRLDLHSAEPVTVGVQGYRLVHWEGAVPGDLAETFARSRRAMDDMPMDEAGYEPQPWDVDRLHSIAAAVARRGEILHTTAVVAPDGEIAGFTELVVPGDGRGDGQNYGTAVLPAHRGHGLAQWIKAESIRRVRARFPELDGLLADTAESNTPMRRINESLGYRPAYTSRLYQHDVTPK